MTLSKEKVSAFVSKYSMYLILVGMIIIMSVLKGENFNTWNNYRNIIRQMTPIGIMALGVTFCIITEGTDLSGGSVIAMCSVVAAHMAHPGEFSLIVTILVTVLAGILAGSINGAVIAYGKVPPFIATLGMMSAARGAAMLLSDGKPISNFSGGFKFIGGGSIGIVPMPVIVFAICCIIAYILLQKTKYGAYIYAIGGNENAAIVSGVNVKSIKMSAYALAGMFTAIGAIVLTARQESGQPQMGVGYDMEAITCAIIGGTSFSGGIGTISGTIVGALIMGVLANGMTMLQVNPNWQMVVKGVVIVLAVLLDMYKNRKK